MTDNFSKLRRDQERLKLEKENAQLRADLGSLQAPWWRRASVVTSLTAIVAAIVPVTTAVQQHFQKEREVALQESKQEHEIRVSYLDRLERPGDRMRTLRFVLATTSDPKLRAWADGESKIVQAELDAIQKQIDAVQKQVATNAGGCPTLDQMKKLTELQELLARESQIAPTP